MSENPYNLFLVQKLGNFWGSFSGAITLTYLPIFEKSKNRDIKPRPLGTPLECVFA